jgi:HEAT repeat protein
MTEPQREACLQFALKRISQGELFVALGRDLSTTPNDTIQLLRQARDARSAYDVDSSLDLLFRFQPTVDYVPLLCELLVDDFHSRHEDIIGALQDAADTYSIPFLRQAILLKPQLAYLSYDNYGSYYKKCFWALKAIGSPEAIAVIREFTNSEDSVAREQAIYRLSKI